MGRAGEGGTSVSFFTTKTQQSSVTTTKLHTLHAQASHSELPPLAVGSLICGVVGLDLSKSVEVQLSHERAEFVVCKTQVV